MSKCRYRVIAYIKGKPHRFEYQSPDELSVYRVIALFRDDFLDRFHYQDLSVLEVFGHWRGKVRCSARSFRYWLPSHLWRKSDGN